MKTLGQRLRYLRKYRGFTQVKLTELIGEKSSSVFSNWEQDLSSPDYEKLLTICKILDVHPSYLLGYSGGEKITTPERERVIDMLEALDEQGLKLVSAVTEVLYGEAMQSKSLDPAGLSTRPINFLQLPYPDGKGNVVSRVDENGKPLTINIRLNDDSRAADYVLELKGNSMAPEFEDGDLILIRAGRAPVPGELAVFGLEDEATFRKLARRHLIPLNDRYDPVEIREAVTCYGKVLGKAVL